MLFYHSYLISHDHVYDYVCDHDFYGDHDDLYGYGYGHDHDHLLLMSHHRYDHGDDDAHMSDLHLNDCGSKHASVNDFQ